MRDSRPDCDSAIRALVADGSYHLVTKPPNLPNLSPSEGMLWGARAGQLRWLVLRDSLPGASNSERAAFGQGARKGAGSNARMKLTPGVLRKGLNHSDDWA